MQSLPEQLTAHLPKNRRFYTIAIDGRGGSGKTQLAAYLGVRLPEFLIINGDDYFEPLQNESAWGEFNERRFYTDVLAHFNADQATSSISRTALGEERATLHNGG